MNMKFEYLYRDSGNNKNWGEVVFSNPVGLSVAKIEALICQSLIDGEYFVPSDVNLPVLYFARFDPELDHAWHEFSRVEETAEPPTDISKRTIEEFAAEVWNAFELVKN